MVLQHAVDISVAYAAEQGKSLDQPPQDVSLTIPSFATQTQRQALLDAATLAGLNVLGLVDETVASALHYAMDKNFDEPQTILFYNMGATALQVAVVRFFTDELPQKYGKPKKVPALQVLAKTADSTIGGQALDHVILEFLADEFNTAWHKASGKKDGDVRQVPRALQKLKIQANKVKHVLSANTEIPVYMDAVHDDVNLQTTISRDKLEQLAHDLWSKAVAPVTLALKMANITDTSNITVELLGGGMRVPRIQTELAKALKIPEADLGKHINSDESMALGAAFAGANVSTAFRVRHVGMTDITSLGFSVALSDASDAEWSKQATVFKAYSKLGVKKTIAFTHTTNIECALDYDDSNDDAPLPEGTPKELERYKISGIDEFAKEKEELGKPKISLQFELSSSGIASLVKAEAAVEETYTVEEEVEVDDDEAADKGDDEKTSTGDEKEKKDDEAEKKEDEEKEDEKESKDDEKNATDDKKDKKKPKKTIKVEKVRTNA